MTRIKKISLLFAVGAVGYGIIEILWRGYTHPTMLLAGGLSFVSFAYIEKLFATKPLILKAVFAAVSVTLIELLFGAIFNLGLNMQVWDYSDLPLNFKGQICLLFSGAWWLLGFVFVPLAAAIYKIGDN